MQQRKGGFAFIQIVDTVKRVLDGFDAGATMSLDAVDDAEAWARRQARQLIAAAG